MVEAWNIGHESGNSGLFLFFVVCEKCTAGYPKVPKGTEIGRFFLRPGYPVGGCPLSGELEVREIRVIGWVGVFILCSWRGESLDGTKRRWRKNGTYYLSGLLPVS